MQNWSFSFYYVIHVLAQMLECWLTVIEMVLIVVSGVYVTGDAMAVACWLCAD